MWSIWPDLHRLETGKVFSSSADAVMIPNSEELNFSGEITVSAWVKIDSTGGLKTILGHGHGDGKEVYLRLIDNLYQFGSWDRITPDHLVSANIPAEDIGEWVHLVGTYDGANWNLYRNGTLLASRADTTGALTVNANWHIGSSNGNSRFFDGEIREVAIWDSALNAAQAAAVYAGTTPSADYPTVVTSYTYDAAGHLLTLTDPVGNTTSYTYNYMGLVATETNEKNATRYYSYDALGRLVSKTDRNGRITTYSYDTIGRLTSENWSDTTNYFMYTYDAVGNLLYATDGQHSYSYTYDALNRPIYTTFNFDSQSAVFAYTYDLAGRQTSSSLSLNGHSDRVNQVTYDFLGNATKITQTGSAVDEIFAEFEYNANGLMTAVRRYEEDANDVVTSIAESLYTYNANNAVTSITHKNPNGTQIVQHSYTYDSTNNIVEYLNSIDGSTTYDYDFLGQLIGADYANGSISDENYTYDENGNRVTANGNTYTTGDNNELTSDGTWTYTYDAEGNRISKTNAANTERELYTWDYRNRLTTVTKQTCDTLTNEWTTVQIVEYAYDYNNIWIRKTLDTNGDGIADSKTIFIPENYQTTVQLDDTDLTDATGPVVTHHYLWTPNQQDKLLADTTTSGILWALTDHLGTIRDVLDGNSSTHLIYDAFGNIVSGTNPLLFGYTGKAFDPATNLQNNINRWYDATIGRWLSTDPIGFNGNDTNLYRYVNHQVLIGGDLFGLYRRKFFQQLPPTEELGEAANWEVHHLYPQQFRKDIPILQIDIDIDDVENLVLIDKRIHLQISSFQRKWFKEKFASFQKQIKTQFPDLSPQEQMRKVRQLYLRTYGLKDIEEMNRSIEKLYGGCYITSNSNLRDIHTSIKNSHRIISNPSKNLRALDRLYAKYGFGQMDKLGAIGLFVDSMVFAHETTSPSKETKYEFDKMMSLYRRSMKHPNDSNLLMLADSVVSYANALGSSSLSQAWLHYMLYWKILTRH